MKQIIPLLTFLFLNITFSQQKGLVYYGFIESLNEGNAKGADSNAYLLFNKEQSFFVTAKDSLEKTSKLNTTSVYTKNYEGKREYTGKRTLEGDQVVYNIKTKTIWSSFFLDKRIYIKEDATNLNWKISKETKKIGKFECKKATTFFRGRNYIAWFTSDVSVSFGPWKLNGLPGLILEAYDTNKSVYWYFKSVEYPTQNKENITFIKNAKGKKITNFVGLKEFNKFCTQRLEEAKEINRINQKQLQGIILVDPELKEMFIEF